jgi:hypothetical protein
MILLFLSIPIGPRTYAYLIIKPETYTLEATRFTLNTIPGINVKLDGPDLIYSHQENTGRIALGEPNRGVALLGAYAFIGVFVIFTRIRPFWQVVILVLTLIPLTAFCNLLRMVCYGLITIYYNAGPLSSVPRYSSAILSLLFAYGIFAATCFILAIIPSILTVEEDLTDERTDDR